MNKKKNNIFLKILFLLFIVFMGLYIANESGYYESKIREDVTITEKGIQEFERKVQAGEEVDMKSFLNNNKVDYSSKMSTLGDNITDNLETIIDESSKVVKSILKSLF